MHSFIGLMKYTRQFFGIKVFLFGITAGIANSFLIAIINQALKQLGNPKADFPLFILAYFSTLAGFYLLQFFYQAILIKISERIVFTTRMEILHKIKNADYSNLERIGATDIFTLLTRDSYAMGSVVNMASTSLISVFTIVGSLIYLAIISLTGVALVGGVVAISLLIAIAQQKANIRKWTRLMKIEDTFMGYVRDLLFGIKEMKSDANANRDLYQNYLLPQAGEYRDHRVSSMIFQTRFSLMGHFIFFLTIGCILFILPFFKIYITPNLSQFVIVTLYILTPIQVMMTLIPQFSYVMASVKRTEEMKDQLVTEQSGTTYPVNAFKTLTINDLCYSYPANGEGGGFQVGPIGLEIRSEEIILIYGGNASGKSTFIKLLAGLYKPSRGSIMVDGNDLCTENIQQYRELFSVVFTDNYLFQTIYGLHDLPVGKIEDLLVRMKLQKKVSLTGKRYSDINLSEGQKKRLALINSLLSDKCIYIFDEWAANQDPEFRHYFYKTLVPELKARKKTVILISHDDKYFNIADRIFKMEYGRLCELDPPFEEFLSFHQRFMA